MRLILGTAGNPIDKHLLLLGSQHLVRLRWRHNTSASVAMIRWIMVLSSGLPGTMAPPAIAASAGLSEDPLFWRRCLDRDMQKCIRKYRTNIAVVEILSRKTGWNRRQR